MFSKIALWFDRLTPLQMALLLALVAQALFVVALGRPDMMMFDETHYVPAARATFGMLQPTNVEHPLFAKWLIGLSMTLFGDSAAGWRALSTAMGTVTILAVYSIALALFGGVRTAATAALLALLNQLVYVQARIAMLDIYMGAFLLTAAALILHKRQPGWLIVAGLCLGLAVGSKWAAIPHVAAILILFAVAHRREGARAVGEAFAIGLASLAAYFATFLPALLYAREPLTLAGLIPYQSFIYAQQTQALAPHTYMSDWWDWPLITRPIWYLYEPVDGVMRGVLLIGNPAIMWGGLIAVVACLWARERTLLLVAGLYLFSMALWIVIPKKIGFYYYYYLPAIFLCLALAGAFHRYCREGRARAIPAVFLAVSVALFVYFFPILSAAALPNDQAFLEWMWFESWR